MTNLKKRERAKTNASLISMVQRFSDITIMFAGLWLVCEVSGLSFLYMHLLVALKITLKVQFCSSRANSVAARTPRHER